MSVSITRDEWLHALHAVGHTDEHDEEAITVADFMAMFNLPRYTAERQLRDLVRAGQARKTRKRAIAGDGRFRHLVAFRLTERVTPTGRRRRPRRGVA